MSKTESLSPRSPDRKLGKSWQQWDGEAKEGAGCPPQEPWLFFRILAFGLVLVTGILILDGLLLNRFVFAPYPLARCIAILVIGVPLAVWWTAYFLCLAATLFRTPMHAVPTLSKWLPMQVPFLVVCGYPFGVSRDRISASCIAVTNVLARLQLRTSSGERPIILLPRCMAQDVVETVRETAAAWDCPVFVMETNEQARRKVRDADPTCVITAACERDLVSGLFDFGAKLPIIGIANLRPHGPCCDTRIDVEELKDALTAVLGKPTHHAPSND